MASKSQHHRKLLSVVIAAVVTSMAPITTAAVPVPAGTRLFARLDTPASTGSLAPCIEVRAVLTGASDGGSLWTAPQAGIVLQGFAHTVAHAGLGRRALLSMSFVQISTGQGAMPARLRLLELDNASARVNRGNLIQGTSPWTSRRGKVEDLLLIGSPAAPILLFPWAGTKLVTSAFFHPRIRLQPGLALTLVANEDIDIPGLVPIAATPNSKIESVLDLQPLQTFAHNGRHTSDLTNVAIVGSADPLLRAFNAAGWSRAEPLSMKSRTKLLAALIHPHTYKRAPVSTQFLEGRPPDLVFEREDDTLAKRDHVRFWLLGSANGDQTVWLGAATHDCRHCLSSPGLWLHSCCALTSGRGTFENCFRPRGHRMG